MRQRLTVLILGVLGAVLIALGIASATVWRADDVLVARATAEAGTTLLVTDPGVLSLAGHPVTVTASAPGTIVVAIGRDTDVNGWVGSDRATHVTGLASWHTLATASAAPTASGPATSSGSSPAASSTAGAAATDAPASTASASAPAVGTAGTAASGTAPDPAGSDMWIAQATGTGHATLTWPTEQGRWMLLVASTGADAAPPTVQLAWPQTVRTPWLVPGVVAGSLLVVVALWLFLRGLMRSRGDLAVTWNAIETGELVTVGASGSGDGSRGRGTDAPADAPPDGAGAPLTRRQLRERERTAPVPIVVPKLSLRRRGPEDQVDGPVTDVVAGTVPGVPTPAEPTAAAPRSWVPVAETPAADRPGAVRSPGASGGAVSGAVDGGPVEPAAGTAGASANDLARQDDDARPEQPVSRRWRRERRAVPAQAPDVATGAPVTPQTPAVEPADEPAADAAGQVAEAPDTPKSPSAGARADAWRRAWGFPGIEGAGSPSDAAPGATRDDTGNGGQQ